jgi:uncharacterized protein YkwD
MKVSLSGLIILVFTSLKLFSQNVYDSLTISNFREYKPFNTMVDPQNFNAGLLNVAVFFATNEIRKDHNLPQLNYNKALEVTAMMHSEDMAKSNFFSHTNTKNKKHKNPEDRAKLAGIKNPHIAENIVEGFILQYNSNEDVYTGDPGIFYKYENNTPVERRTYLELADELLNLWMNSEGHRANILSKDALELGCGSAFYNMKDFNDMPAVKATQNFQWFEPAVTN